MNIDLGEEYSIAVKYNGNEYKMREPTQLEIRKYRKELDKIDKEDSEAQEEAILGFLSNLGISREVLNSMGFRKLETLINGLMGVKKN